MYRAARRRRLRCSLRLTTLVVIAGISLTAKGRARLWAPVIGIIAGSIVAGIFGLYDVERIARASWIGIPKPVMVSPGPGFRV